MEPSKFSVKPLSLEVIPLSTEIHSMNQMISFDYNITPSKASLRQIAKNITVPNGAENLTKVTFSHGTSILEMRSIVQGPKNMGKGFGAEGLYVFLNEPANAVEYAHIKTQFKGTPGILEGTLNPNKPYVVGRIHLTRQQHRIDLLKGIWPADWAKNPALKNFVQSHFDILEVCGAESAGLNMPTNKFAVVYERAGKGAIRWHKAYALNNKPVPPELISRTLQKNKLAPLGNQSLHAIPRGLEIGLSCFKYGVRILGVINLCSSIREGAAEEASKQPFATPFDLHEARGMVRGVISNYANKVFHVIDPAAASIDPRIAVQARPLSAQQREAYQRQLNADCRENCRRMTPYMHDMLDRGVMPQDLPRQSDSGKALNMDRARAFRTWENDVIDRLIRKFDLIRDPYAAKESFDHYMRYMGDIQIPQDFFTWSPDQQAKWSNDLVSKAETIFDHYQDVTRQLSRQTNNYLSHPRDNLIPDLTGLTPVSPVYQRGCVDPALLSRLPLDHTWTVVRDPDTQMSSLQTSLEIPHEAMTSLSEFCGPAEITSEAIMPHTDIREVDFLPDLSHLPLQRDTAVPERPSFGQLATFTDFELGPGIGGGYGLVGTLDSGAKVSISVTGTAFMVGVSVPLGPGFMAALATGFVYAAPVAAVAFAVHLALDKHRKEVVNHLKKDCHAAGKEEQRVSNSCQNFDHFSDLFQRGDIDRETFLRETNQISANIQKAAHNMGEWGRYADRHGKESDGAGFEYFFKVLKLRQIDLDLKKIAEEAVVKSEVDEQYVPQLKEMSLQGIVKELGDISSKRVVTLSDKYKQDALIQEIAVRGKSGDLDALSHLDRLAGQPVAISLSPNGVAKPHHITKKHFDGSDSSQERRCDRVRKWADTLNEAYSRFVRYAKEGNIGEMNKAAADVRYQINRADGKTNDNVNLKDYKLVDAGSVKTASKYYESFINGIRSNVDTTLDRAKAGQSGKITDQSPEIFTADEIRAMKVQGGKEAFNEARNKHNDPSNGGNDQTFINLHQAALLLHSLGETDPSILNVIEIAAEYPTYTQYQAATDRLNKIRTGIFSLQEKTEKMQKFSNNAKAEEPAEEKSLGGEENYGAIYQSAFEIADALIQEGLTEADIRKIIVNPDEAQKVLEYVRSIHEGFPQYQSTANRLTHIQTELSALQELTNKLCQPKLKREERLKLLQQRMEKAEEMLRGGLTKEVVGQLLDDKNDAESTFAWVQSIRDEYPNLIKIDHYENDIHHRYTSPAIRFALHILHDQQRFYGSSFVLRAGTETLGAMNTLVPNLLPSYVNWRVADIMGENADVVDGLYKSFCRSPDSNVLSKLKEQFQDSKGLNSFNKKAGVLHSANTVVQLAARGISACVPEISVPVTQSAMVLNFAATTFYCTSTVNKTVKYMKACQFGLKVHKVGQGLLSLGTSGFDIYEFLATDASEWGSSAGLIEAVKEYLPNYHGNLPEDKNYYIVKDGMLTAGAVALSGLFGGPVLTGMALFQGGLTLYGAYYSKYTNDVLSAILINIRYFEKNKSWEKKDSSMQNLKHYLGENLKVADGDSPVVQKAKQSAFEYSVEKLVENQNWEELIDLTSIDLDSWKFDKRNIDLFDAINVALKRHSILAICDSTQLLKSFDEFEKVSDHITTQLSTLDAKNKSYVDYVNSNLQSIQQCYITNFCIHYIKDELRVSYDLALKQFDKMPKKNRDSIHWYFLGKLAKNLSESIEPKTHFFDAMQLFSFESTLDILVEKEKSGTLDTFEKSLILCCKEDLTCLREKVKSTLNFSKETEHFAPVVDEILGVGTA